MIALYVLFCASAAVFVIACIVRAVRYASAPIHLRWELYPVPHERADRAAHGGSYFEDGDWWTRAEHTNLIGELKVMLPEMLFLKALWEHNRKLWYRSFTFHFGLYMVIGSLALLAVAAVAGFPALGMVYAPVGLIGTALVILGAAGLLARRLGDPELKNYTVPADVFNLLFFIVTFAALGAGYLTRPEGAPTMYEIARGFLTFDAAVSVPPLLAAGLIAGAVLGAYIPLTHMSHFIAKYFTYHSIRWDDQPLARRRDIERRISEYLTYRPTWSAKHLGADGKKTWAEVAGDNPWATK